VDVELTHFYLKPSLLRVQDADMAMYASFIMACLQLNLSIFVHAASVCCPLRLHPKLIRQLKIGSALCRDGTFSCQVLHDVIPCICTCALLANNPFHKHVANHFCLLVEVSMIPKFPWT
jgi:hypothetical protein